MAEQLAKDLYVGLVNAVIIFFLKCQSFLASLFNSIIWGAEHA